MRSRYRRILVAAGSALAMMALVSPVAQAATPAPPYEDFAGCPSLAENSNISFCVKTTFTGGHLKLGKKNIAITNPIVLRGAAEQNTANFVANSEGGIVPVRQQVDGGLIGLTGIKSLDEEIANQQLLKVYAVVELAGQVGNLEDPALSLPVKVHLENPFLGNGCYVGSNANPIDLNLITGTTSPPPPASPITGQPQGEYEPEASRPQVLTASDGLNVDNTFAVPSANGCLLNLGSQHINIDKLVNAASGLPAAAGKSEAVLSYHFSLTTPGVVYP